MHYVNLHFAYLLIYFPTVIKQSVKRDLTVCYKTFEFFIRYFVSTCPCCHHANANNGIEANTVCKVRNKKYFIETAIYILKFYKSSNQVKQFHVNLIKVVGRYDIK